MSILYIMIYKIEKRNPTPILSVFLYIFEGEHNFFLHFHKTKLWMICFPSVNSRLIFWKNSPNFYMAKLKTKKP